MDQVRAILQTMWRQRFWGLSVVGTLVATLCWMVASGQLTEEFKKNAQNINGKFGTMQALAGKPLLPNKEVNNADLQEAKALRDRVREQWKQLYDRQRTEVLFWPQGEMLGEEFVRHMEGRKFGANIGSEMRDNYWQYIKNRFNPLLKIVQARKQRGGGRGGGGGRGEGGGGGRGEGGGGGRFKRPGAGGPGAVQEEDYLVEWLDQSNLRKKLDFPEKPSALAIWVTQEDLWVYETLLKVIAKTNKLKGAVRPDNTAIHTIVTLEVGRAAVTGTRKKGGILMHTKQSFDIEDQGPGEGRDSFQDEGFSDYGEYGGRGAEDATLLASRYIDAEGVPLAGDLDSLGVEFRRLPIRMVLRMHQRWIPQVLIECANAALPIEVQPVRINPDEAGNGFGGTSGGRPGRSRNSGSRNKKVRGLSPEMVEVVIQGVVYIYNEPEDRSLSIPGEEEEENQLADASDESLQR